ncbi:MAG TPA: Gfo/Idh/MocA family oxidoreductase [Candidatus Omnitrophota bacterium]|nr:Gfo/Idh/MocA family oxidoreductase [Candidatus Omnitrophota bacterium]
MAKIKVGVIGVGSMGENHLRIYSTLKEAKLIGFYESVPERAVQMSEKYHCPAFDNIDSLLSSVEAVSVVTPTSTHYSVISQCLGRGIHVLAEKPMVPTLADSESLVSIAAQKKLVLAVGMIERFNPAFKKLHSIVKHEFILGLELKRLSPFPARISDASVVQDMMLHDVDLALALSRSDVDSVKAAGAKVRTDRLDQCFVTLYFKDGLIAKIEASRINSDKLRTVTVTTDKGIYEADLLNKRLYCRGFDKITDKVAIEIEPEDQLTLELKDFLHAIDKGKCPRVPGADSLPVIKIVEEVEKTAC